MNRRLNRVRDGYYEFIRLEKKVEQLETLATHITPVLTGMPMSHGTGTEKQDTWAMLADYRDELERSIRNYIKISETLETELEIIRKSNIRTAMKMRYIDCMKLEEIAYAMGYSDRQLRRLLRKGEDIYTQEYGNEES